MSARIRYVRIFKRALTDDELLRLSRELAVAQVSTPTFSPAPGNYATSQRITK